MTDLTTLSGRARSRVSRLSLLTFEHVGAQMYPRELLTR
jgi:hypothetical protein